jgi:hypothetical protein
VWKFLNENWGIYMKKTSSAARQFDADFLKICCQAMDLLQTHLDASEQMTSMEVDALHRAVEQVNWLMRDFIEYQG